MKLPKRLQRLPRCTPTREGITALRSIARRNLRDARLEALSRDNRYRLAYEAAFALASMIIQANGFLPERNNGHKTVFSVLNLVIGEEMEDFANFFSGCRAKRHRLSYITSNVVSRDELQGLLEKTAEFSQVTRQWMKEHHRQLI